MASLGMDDIGWKSSAVAHGPTTTKLPNSGQGASSVAAEVMLVSAAIQTLPNEILLTIFECLDSPQPSASGLLSEPTFDMTNAENADLKTISLISKRWRHIVLPILFKHSRCTVQLPKARPRTTPDEDIRPFLRFASHNSLERIIISFVLLVRDEKATNTIERVYQSDEVASFWTSLFQTIEPVDLLIIAPPEALGALTSCHVYLDDKWSFDCPYQYLRLQQPPINRAMVTTPIEPAMLPLFLIRPWSTLLLNEGSFLKAYKTYEFWLKQPPSVSFSMTDELDISDNMSDFITASRSR